MKKICLVAQIILFPLILSACAGMDGLFNRDPLTGGVNSGTSRLLGCQVPAGMQYFPSHSYSEDAGSGLETWRGSLSPASAGLNTHHTLKNDGWQLRLALHTGERYFYLYQKKDRYAAIVIRPQGITTIMEIWVGDALPDGADLASGYSPDTSGINAMEGEEYGSIEESPSVKEETWGVEEREI
ncbi:MAG: hypothetical protein K2H64_00180 [Desulfovibrio sp.]|nr:hypothetical protein [Desulfovibrio sp.]